jgi:hypothetical protein
MGRSICQSLTGLAEGKNVCELLIGRARKSRTRPRQLSYGQLDCLALPLFGIEDLNLEVGETPL